MLIFQFIEKKVAPILASAKTDLKLMTTKINWAIRARLQRIKFEFDCQRLLLWDNSYIGKTVIKCHLIALNKGDNSYLVMKTCMKGAVVNREIQAWSETSFFPRTVSI